MRVAILIRHAPPAIDRNQPANQWQLRDDSYRLCSALAQQISQYHIRHIFTSTEPKAYQTGVNVAQTLGNVSCTSTHDLQETVRNSSKYFEDEQAFRHAVFRAMYSPDELLFGDETFSAARERLTQRIEALACDIERHNFAVVTHGRVMSMYLGQFSDQSPVEIWKALQMPAYAVLSWDNRSLIKIVNSVG